MRKSIFALFALFIAALIWWWLARVPAPHQTGAAVPTAAQPASPAPSATTEAAAPLTGPSPTMAATAPAGNSVAAGQDEHVHDLTAQMPSLAQVRADIARDPHSPPLSGLTFTVAIAQRMRDAQGNKAASVKLFGELEDCSTSKKEAATSVRAMCILSAANLADSYPELKSRYARITRDADPGAVSLARSLK